MPRNLVPHHGIQHDKQLAHGGYEGHFLGLASLTQSLIEGAVRRPLDTASLAEIHDSYNEAKAAYRRVMEQRFAFLKKDMDT